MLPENGRAARVHFQRSKSPVGTCCRKGNDRKTSRPTRRGRLYEKHGQKQRLYGKSTVNAGISGPYDDTIRMLPQFGRPRSVRLGFKAKVTALWVSSPLIVMALAAWDQHRDPTRGITIQGLIIVFAVSQVALWAFFWMRPFLKHKSLISQGEVATVRIAEILRPARGYPYARYAFETPFGKSFTRMGQTARSDLASGMKVPVFYDLKNPKRQIALCCAFFDVVPPGQH